MSHENSVVPSDNQKKDQSSQKKSERKPFRGDFVVLGGVLLPAFTLLFEIVSGLSAQEFLNPIPTLWHVLLVGFVPAANLYLLLNIDTIVPKRPQLIAWSSAVAGGVSLFYSLIYLPVSPLSFFGIIFVGLGFLGLSPMFAFVSIYLIRRHLRKSGGISSVGLSWKGLAIGFLVAFVIVGISESRTVFTKYALEIASSGEANEQEKGLNLLRQYGSKNYLLKLSNSHKNAFYISDTIYNLFVHSKASSTNTARETFYRLYGKTYEQSSDSGGMFDMWGDDDAEPRMSQRADSRMTLNEDLSLIESEMNGSIDNEASLGYLEWRLRFKNASKWSQAEAVGQIQLPPNSVVSRLTLWVNGEEREAAFAERSRVTKAYEAVVSRNRDPVLVTSAGRDRVDMNCFPVMPKNGEMQIRIGITFPLTLENRKKGILRLPYFKDKNFQVNNDFAHQISILSTNKLTAGSKTLKLIKEGRFFVLKGSVGESSLTDSTALITASRFDKVSSLRAKFEKGYIKQEIRKVKVNEPSRFVFVVDTSERMKGEAQKIAMAIEDISSDAEVALVITHGNGLNKNMVFPTSYLGTRNEIAKKLENVEFGGGVDNLPSIIKAWNLANEVDNGVVIWIHAPQPFEFDNSDNLANHLIRRPNRSQIYSFSVGKEAGEIERQLNDLEFIGKFDRFGDLQSDVKRLVSKLDNSSESLEYIRTIDDEADVTVDKTTSKHLARLWAYEEVNRILASGLDENQATELAVKYQLVTPVTGAVVLETKEQYNKAGLKPVEKNVVHAVPEPGTYLMMLMGIGLIFFVVWRRM